MLLMAFIGVAVFPFWAQQSPASKPSVPDLLTKLQSKDWTERSDAVDEIRADPDALRSPKIRATLIDLLDRENRETDEALRNAKNPRPQANTESTEGDAQEGYGEYCAWLSQTVESFANWNDPHQACILVDAAQITYPSQPQAAARARAAMPCLLRQSQSDLEINREIALPLLAEGLEKARGTLDAKTAETAREIILGDLRDPSAGMRAAAVDALRQFGTPDVIPALEEVVAKDPEPEVDGHSIRKYAAEAIAEIRKRKLQR
jgi:HEAT repeat protein